VFNDEHSGAVFAEAKESDQGADLPAGGSEAESSKSTPPMNTRFRARRLPARAFTLIELLTVIAIIGVLAAILIPTVGKVRATAKKAQCISNLRQWGSAVRLMANDRKGMVPLSNAIGSDQQIYGDYFGQKTMINVYGESRPSQEVMSRCPNDPIIDKNDPQYRARSYTFARPTLGVPSGVKSLDPTSYGMNAGSSLSGYSINDATSPSQLVLMVESHSLGGNNAYTVDNPSASWDEHVKPMQTNTDPRLVRHNGLANILFLDGHVASYTQGQTNYSSPALRPSMMRWFTLR
jgi:prepilin-type processing-associated H-X9-DG protein/prepilin-type N-terminal cleavage/methylation domain-containing protein